MGGCSSATTLTAAAYGWFKGRVSDLDVFYRRTLFGTQKRFVRLCVVIARESHPAVLDNEDAVPLRTVLLRER